MTPSQPKLIGEVLHSLSLSVCVEVRGTKLPGIGSGSSVFMVSSIAGEWGCGSFTSDSRAAICRAITIEVTSAMGVTRSSCASCLELSLANMVSKTRQIVPICLSHTPPKEDACGGFSFNSH